MFKKETEYALRGLVYIQFQNLKGKRPGVAEIASEIETPKHFMAKILQRLVRLGFVESLKGINGGFFFDETKSDLTLEDIIIAIEGDKILSGCVLGLNFCDAHSTCPVHESYVPIRDKLNKLISEETIQSLASKNYGDLEIVLNRL